MTNDAFGNDNIDDDDDGGDQINLGVIDIVQVFSPPSIDIDYNHDDYDDDNVDDDDDDDQTDLGVIVQIFPPSASKVVIALTEAKAELEGRVSGKGWNIS